MSDAADRAAANDERAMKLFEEQQRRIAESHRPYDPDQDIDCVDCGEPVPRERVEAYPHTRRCIACAADVQQSYRRSVPSWT